MPASPIKKWLKLVVVAYFVATSLIIHGLVGAKIYKTISSYYGPMELKNGYSLAPTGLNRKNVRLLDPDGDEVVSAHIEDIQWCDNIIAGKHIVKKDGVIDRRLFIYDGNEKHLYEYTEAASFDEKLDTYYFPTDGISPKNYVYVPKPERIGWLVPCPGRDSPYRDSSWSGKLSLD